MSELSGNPEQVPYTPTTEEVLNNFMLAEMRSYQHRGLVWGTEDVTRYAERFDRWLAEVKAQNWNHTFAQQLEEHSLAELIRMAKADAWEECAQEAYDRGMLHDITFEDIQTLNPYRQGATE